MKLDEFIRDNREAFDDQQPPEKVWKNIHANLQFSKPTGFWSGVVIWRAAAVFFMALSAFLGYNTYTAQNKQAIALQEFQDVETFYVAQISEKVEMIDSFSSVEEVDEFTQEFKQLEAMYMVLKEEMRSHPSQKVKDALVLNLLVQIDLLNQQLHKLEVEVNRNTDRDQEEKSI